MFKRKILIMGLPGTGKTTLAKILAPKLQAVHFNADEIRNEVNPRLSFSLEDRIEQARRMGWLCDQVVRSGNFVVADFICPTNETRAAFGAKNAFIVWVNRINRGRFEDTNKLFVPPEIYDVCVTGENNVEFWADHICSAIKLQSPQRGACTNCAQLQGKDFG